MSSARQVACFGAFYDLLKEVAPFISNKNPVDAEMFITFLEDRDSPGHARLLPSDMICHLNDNGCIVLKACWKFQV